MNKRQKELAQLQLDSEQEVLKALAKQYRLAEIDIIRNIRILQSDELTQSKIYQLQYQQALRGVITSAIEKLHSGEFTTIQAYLEACYTDGFVGTMYDMHGQGVPVIIPLDQETMIRAITTDSKINTTLYAALGVDTNRLKKTIREEITRGLAEDLPTNEIARNIHLLTGAGLYNAKRIAWTEGHRIRCHAQYDAQKESKSKGADVVKQWDATLDGNTRPDHQRLDGQIREVEEPFEVAGKTAMYPGDFGDPAEDCNCRCSSLSRARWALDETELQTLKDRAEYFELDKTEDFEDFKKKYLDAAAEEEYNFDNINSFDDLQDYLEKNYSIRMTAGIKKLDFEAVKSATVGIDSMLREFPDISRVVKQIRVASSKQVMSYSGTGAIAFSPEYFLDIAEIADECRFQSDIKWWYPNSSPASVGVHETAHALEMFFVRSNPAYQTEAERAIAWNDCVEADNIVSRALNAHRNATKSTDSDYDLLWSISAYAAKTPSEAFSEAFADVYANGENANPVSIAIRNEAIRQLEAYRKGV